MHPVTLRKISPRQTPRVIKPNGDLWCPGCSQEKNFTLFAIDRSNKCGRVNYCRKCCSIKKGNKFQHHHDFPLDFVKDHEVRAQVLKEGWARWGFFPAVVKRCIENPARWSLIRCENNYYQHYAIEFAMRRQSRAVSVKVRILHGENGVFVKLMSQKEVKAAKPQ